MGCEVAVSIGEECVRRTPGVGVYRARSALEITWDGPITSLPEPDLDKASCSLHGVETAADRIEGGAEAVGCRGLHTTAHVARRDDVANVACGISSLVTTGRHVAVRIGVQRHGVGTLAVDTFDPG